MPRLRVGIVDFLNSRPLAWGFLEGRWRDRFEACYHKPSRVASMLAAGELDIGLIPSIELQRIPDLRVVPGLSVSSQREVRSVVLVSKVSPGAIRSVALDTSSRTSAVLVQIVLQERFEVTPELHRAPPDLASMLSAHDAALLIGDPALAVDHQHYQVVDLAAEWRALTGLPFVFAVWAVAPGVDGEGLEAVFRESLRAGLVALPRIVERAAADLGLELDLVHRYLTWHLSFGLGEEELAALAAFHIRAAALGEIETVRPLRLLGFEEGHLGSSPDGHRLAPPGLR